MSEYLLSKASSVGKIRFRQGCILYAAEDLYNIGKYRIKFQINKSVSNDIEAPAISLTPPFSLSTTTK
jgi:hypothetical protein